MGCARTLSASCRLALWWASTSRLWMGPAWEAAHIQPVRPTCEWWRRNRSVPFCFLWTFQITPTIQSRWGLQSCFSPKGPECKKDHAFAAFTPMAMVMAHHGPIGIPNGLVWWPSCLHQDQVRPVWPVRSSQAVGGDAFALSLLHLRSMSLRSLRLKCSTCSRSA
jgi:hypothetical protein